MGEISTKTLAEIYLQQGDFQKAYEIFKSLSEKDPSDTEIQERLKEMSQKLGYSCPIAYELAPTADHGIQSLKRWLHNIQKRRRK
jgi:DNA-binding SARP family transcriptional activator